jgi:hypothetical protein
VLAPSAAWCAPRCARVNSPAAAREEFICFCRRRRPRVGGRGGEAAGCVSEIFITGVERRINDQCRHRWTARARARCPLARASGDRALYVAKTNAAIGWRWRKRRNRNGPGHRSSARRRNRRSDQRAASASSNQVCDRLSLRLVEIRELDTHPRGLPSDPGRRTHTTAPSTSTVSPRSPTNRKWSGVPTGKGRSVTRNTPPSEISRASPNSPLAGFEHSTARFDGTRSALRRTPVRGRAAAQSLLDQPAQVGPRSSSIADSDGSPRIRRRLRLRNSSTNRAFRGIVVTVKDARSDANARVAATYSADSAGWAASAALRHEDSSACGADVARL